MTGNEISEIDAVTKLHRYNSRIDKLRAKTSKKISTLLRMMPTDGNTFYLPCPGGTAVGKSL